MNITVKDIRDAIADLPDEAPVFFSMESGCCGDQETLELWDVSPELNGGMKELKKYLRFYFNAVPGYEYCRGRPKRKDNVNKP